MKRFTSKVEFSATSGFVMQIWFAGEIVFTKSFGIKAKAESHGRHMSTLLNKRHEIYVEALGQDEPIDVFEEMMQ